MGQRPDIEIDLPNEGGAWLILALRECARECTGLILATQGAEARRPDALAETEAPAFDIDLAQKPRLIARDALSQKLVDCCHMLMLGGSLLPYVWTINGAAWGQYQPITARSGERLVLLFHNISLMAHPMHLHGHVFQVVGLNGRRFAGADPGGTSVQVSPSRHRSYPVLPHVVVRAGKKAHPTGSESGV